MSQRVYNTPHAIDPNKLTEIMAFLGPRLAGQPVAFYDEDGAAEKMEKASALSFHALSHQGTASRLAVIEVNGTLLHRAHGMDAWSGACTYEATREEIRAALNDYGCDGIMLRIDSCGGEVNGLESLGQFIYQSRGAKPIWCAVDDVAFSAAYWIASACDRIFVSGTGMVGSVGVIAMHSDQSKFDSEIGLKYTTIFAGARKNDLNPHEPLADGARARVQADVDELYEKFVAAVAKHRGITAEAVRATEADVYRGEECILRGLADKMGDYETAMAAMAAHVANTKLKPATASAKAAINPKGERAMPEELNPDATIMPEDDKKKDQATSSTEQPDEPAAAKRLADAVPIRVTATFEQVAELCETQGLGIKEAREIHAMGKTREEVAIHLLTSRRQAELSAPVRSHVAPSGGMSSIGAIDKAAIPFINAGKTKQQAIVAALQANPALYDQYLAENPRQTGRV